MGARAARRATEENLRHRGENVDNYFPKNENVFTNVSKAWSYKGFSPAPDLPGNSETSPDPALRTAPYVHWQRLNMPEELQARRAMVAILWVSVSIRLVLLRASPRQAVAYNGQAKQRTLRTLNAIHHNIHSPFPTIKLNAWDSLSVAS